VFDADEGVCARLLDGNELLEPHKLRLRRICTARVCGAGELEHLSPPLLVGHRVWVDACEAQAVTDLLVSLQLSLQESGAVVFRLSVHAALLRAWRPISTARQ
jgi:hypothetical protein